MATIYSKSGADAATAAAIDALNLGTAATTDADEYATAAQGALADSAVQPGDLGTAAAADAGDFATAEQGEKADASDVDQITLTGDLALTVPAGFPAGQVYRVTLTQDGTGGHTVTYDGQPLDIAAAGSTAVDFRPDGAGGRMPSSPGKRKPGVGPEWWGSEMGFRYDGTDETATVNAALATISAAGGGVLHVEGLVRCDGQIVIPTALTGIQLRQAPIRITGTVQTMPGGTFGGVITPYPKAGGFDLRYAGRADAGCSTTQGSAIVLNPNAQASDRGLIVSGPGIPDQAWIIAVDPGVSWTLYRPARATAASVTLSSFGGRIQAYGYGTLELDHLQLVSGGASSAPFAACTATTIIAHDNLIAGMPSKNYLSCDEDAFVLGGPGQGTRLTAPLTSGTKYTTLAVAPIPVGVTTGRRILIGAGTAAQQEVTLAASAVTGANELSVSEFTPTASHPVSQSVYFGYAQSQINPTSWSVPSCPWQGYGTEISRNHFHRVRRISVGGFATGVIIRRNAWMHNCGSNLAAAPSTLTTGLTKGTTYSTLAVSALARPVLAGDVIQTDVSRAVARSQEWVAAADVAAGGTSIPVVPTAAREAFAVGTKVILTADIGVSVESFAIGPEANSLVVSENRIGVISYNYSVRLRGATQQSVIFANDLQDAGASTTLIAGTRCDRTWLWGAKFNLIIPGLLGGSVLPLDDWSNVDGRHDQTVLAHDDDSPALFSQGFAATGEASRFLPLSDASTATLSPRVLAPDLASFWQSSHTTIDKTVRHNVGGVESPVLRLRDSGGTHSLDFFPTAEAVVRTTTGHLMLIAKTDGKVCIGGADAPGLVYVSKGKLYAPVVVLTPTTTASRPTPSAAGAGAMIYDSTLSKPLWSDGTAWRDAMGTAV